MQKKLQYHVQSVLVPVGHYNNIQQAANHVQSLGYNPEFKSPHVTKNYIRFRQYTPKAGENYRTEHLDSKGDKVIMAVPQKHSFDGLGSVRMQPHHRLGENGHGIYHPSHHEKIPPKGPTHEYYFKDMPNEKRTKDIQQRHRAELKQQMHRDQKKRVDE